VRVLHVRVLHVLLPVLPLPILLMLPLLQAVLFSTPCPLLRGQVAVVVDNERDDDGLDSARTGTGYTTYVEDARCRRECCCRSSSMPPPTMLHWKGIGPLSGAGASTCAGGSNDRRLNQSVEVEVTNRNRGKE
jgi:hypothetical protein